MRNEILNYITNLLNSNKNVVKTVTRQYSLLTDFRPFELPVVMVVDGIEVRENGCNRDICNFEVILRIVVYNEDNTSEILNQCIEECISILYSDKFLGGNSLKAVSVRRIETDEGWLYPYGMADIRVETSYNYNK